MADRFTRIEMEGVVIAIASAPHVRRVESSLSPAERAVATMLVEGLTNAEIATARGASIRTVANQVRSILAKLGARSRRDVARALLGVD